MITKAENFILKKNDQNAVESRQEESKHDDNIPAIDIPKKRKSLFKQFDDEFDDQEAVKVE